MPDTTFAAAGGLLVRAGRAIAATLGVVLLPKCPLCVAAYLVSFGLSASAAACLAPLIRPLALTLATLACLALGYGSWRSRTQRLTTTRRASASCCCD
jgi:hypothetical protein